MKSTKYFSVVLLLTFGWIVVMRIFSPPNIVQFEFAGTAENAAKIMEAWGTAGVEQARFSTYLDFIFLVLYSASISMGCRIAGGYSKVAWLIKTGNTLAPLIWLAAVCDAIENISMLSTLQTVAQSTVTIAYYCAAIKFIIVSVGLIFILTGFSAGIMKKFKPTANN
jgi:hypothetical protein